MILIDCYFFNDGNNLGNMLDNGMIYDLRNLFDDGTVNWHMLDYCMVDDLCWYLYLLIHRLVHHLLYFYLFNHFLNYYLWHFFDYSPVNYLNFRNFLDHLFNNNLWYLFNNRFSDTLIFGPHVKLEVGHVAIVFDEHNQSVFKPLDQFWWHLLNVTITRSFKQLVKHWFEGGCKHCLSQAVVCIL